MKRKLVWAFLGLFLVLCSAGRTWGGDTSGPYPIMKPDRETRLKWINAYETAPKAYIDPSRHFNSMLGGSLSLLSRLPYTPSERNQGSCGNCWAWAGTGVMEIALDVQENIFDRLSVQFISSCNTLKDCCDGGWLSDFASFYGSKTYTIPWSNTNASWQNGDGNCNVPCATISISPSHRIDSIVGEAIPTHGLGQATAIANIKNVLNQNRAVWFGFFMGTAEDWNNFRSFWRNQPESALWDFDPTCNKPWSWVEGGGHAVLCVGYNDDDPGNSYWIMLNSWGTTAGRPNGIFRVAMDMNYDCADTNNLYNLFWQTLDVTFSTSAQTIYVEIDGLCNGRNPCYSKIQAALDVAEAGIIIKVAGGMYPEAPNWKGAGTVTISGGWNAEFTEQTGTTKMYAPRVSGGGRIEIQPRTRVTPKP